MTGFYKTGTLFLKLKNKETKMISLKCDKLTVFSANCYMFFSLFLYPLSVYLFSSYAFSDFYLFFLYYVYVLKEVIEKSILKVGHVNYILNFHVNYIILVNKVIREPQPKDKADRIFSLKESIKKETDVVDALFGNL